MAYWFYLLLSLKHGHGLEHRFALVSKFCEITLKESLELYDEEELQSIVCVKSESTFLFLEETCALPEGQSYTG